MSLLKKIVLSFFIIIISVSSSFALMLEGDIKLDEAKSTSLEVSWDAVDGSIGYFVYYDTVSHSSDKNYGNSIDDMISATGTLVDGLKGNTEYYIAIRVVDGEGDEGDFSKEVVYSTLNDDNENAGGISIDLIEVSDINSLVVTFTKTIDTTKNVEFKIEEKENNLIEKEISTINIEGNKVFVKLENELELDKNYTLTVISIVGSNGETINAGVDGLSDFTTSNLVELNSAEDTSSTAEDTSSTAEDTSSTTEDIDNIQDGNISSESESEIIINNDSDLNNVELNSAAPETGTSSVLSGKNLSNDEIKKTAELAASKTEKLPQTGPVHWILVILALLLAFGITRIKKEA